MKSSWLFYLSLYTFLPIQILQSLGDIKVCLHILGWSHSVPAPGKSFLKYLFFPAILWSAEQLQALEVRSGQNSRLVIKSVLDFIQEVRLSGLLKRGWKALILPNSTRRSVWCWTWTDGSHNSSDPKPQRNQVWWNSLLKVSISSFYHQQLCSGHPALPRCHPLPLPPLENVSSCPHVAVTPEINKQINK